MGSRVPGGLASLSSGERQMVRPHQHVPVLMLFQHHRQRGHDRIFDAVRARELCAQIQSHLNPLDAGGEIVGQPF